jgi:hypothetical protein
MGCPLIIIGAGGHGAEIAAYALDMGLPLVGVIDDGKPKGAWQMSQIIGGMNDLPAFCQGRSEVGFITAFGSNDLRRKMVLTIAGLGLSNLKPFTLQHRSAWRGVDVQIGEATLLSPNVAVTTRVHIGRHGMARPLIPPPDRPPSLSAQAGSSAEGHARMPALMGNEYRQPNGD